MTLHSAIGEVGDVALHGGKKDRSVNKKHNVLRPPAFTDYEAYGWKLCAIERGRKAPVYDGWNVSPFPAESIEALGNGGGLLHAESGTCALDIDNMELARPWLAERGVEIDALM